MITSHLNVYSILVNIEEEQNNSKDKSCYTPTAYQLEHNVQTLAQRDKLHAESGSAQCHCS